MSHKFKASQYPRPFPSKEVPIYAPLPGTNLPKPAPEPVGVVYTPLSVQKRPQRLPAPDLLDPIDYPEMMHPSYTVPSYFTITHPPLY